MKIACYNYQNQTYVGQLSDDEKSLRPYLIETHLAKQGLQSIVDLQAQGKALPDLGDAVDISQVQLQAPIPRPRRNVFCVGKNYLDHVNEIKDSKLGQAQGAMANLPKHPVIFSKVPEAVIGHGQGIQAQASVTQEVDYEAELAVIIGKQGRGISVEKAYEYVWGYTIINDISARDLQAKHVQFHLGKSLDTFCPMGPWAVTADQVDAKDLAIKCWVNDELRQNATTALMIFDIPTIISQLSAGITLYPGDIIATGTPSGVGMGMKPPQFLKSGDRIKIQIDGLGVLENPVVA